MPNNTMTKKEFEIFWTSMYPDTVPISHLFRHKYSDRWFRIHSLPESKRYADDETEWNILLLKQNKIITDLLGVDTNILLLTGEYNWGKRTTHITEEENIFKTFHFVRLENIDLFNLNSEDYDKNEIYRPSFAETIWKPNLHDKLLREIAVDNVRAFFVAPDKNVIVAPYDGGIDFILKDIQTRDFYKNKYKKWLSGRVDDL